jgi:long-chain acyl-CoA synthetase
MYDNLVSLFFAQALRLWERPFLWELINGRYACQTWREVAASASALARGLKALGVGHHDRVMLVCENRSAFLISDTAIMAAGGITVPAYTTNTADQHRYILENSGACGVIASTPRLAERVIAALQPASSVKFLITVEPGLSRPPPVRWLSWQEASASGASDHANLVAAASTIGREDPACIIYTSGTGGQPKGVVLPHRAILHNCEGGIAALADLGRGDEVFLSFLPLSHAYEHTIGQFLPIALGAEIYYVDGVDKLASAFVQARPTIVTAVPRFYELMRERIEKQVARAPRLERWLFAAALKLGRERIARGRLSPMLHVIDAALDRLVRKRVRARFGGRIKAMISGGAPLDPAVGHFFQALGLPIFQGYGQTEAGPLISVNRAHGMRMETVGPPMPGVEVKIAEDGEILVRGDLLMLGYWQNEAATREVLRDGWLHTGDIGSLDADGHLRITDRKKDIIVNSGGDNVSPTRVEALLMQRPEIAQAMVYGDGRPHLVALIVPDDDWLRARAKALGEPIDNGELSEDSALHRALRPVVDAVNAELSVIERVRRFVVLRQPFSLDNSQLTPTLKMRRHVIRDAYRDVLERLYR